MNTLFYHPKTKSWHHPKAGHWFGNTEVQQGSPANSYRFFVQQYENKLGPLVGILTSGSSEGKVYGDWKRFSSLQLEMQSRGGISIIFTPYGVHEAYIGGYVMLPNAEWRPCRIPFPDVVYNRIPYRTHEKKDVSQQTLTLLQTRKIPLFNPGFFSKWDVHRALQQNSFLQKHLLPTEALYQKEEFIRMLDTYTSIYVKHCEASKGKQLLRVKRSHEYVVLEPVHGKTMLMNEAAAWDEISQNGQLFLAQPSLSHDEHNGRKYDLRVLVHFISHSFHISGIGVRVAGANNLVTHIPNGGTIVSTSELARPIQHDVLNKIVQECGTSLCTAFGRIREFSLDIGIDRHGQYYIFEANAKPMIFDEVHIQKKAVQNLVTVFEEEAGFSHSIL